MASVLLAHSYFIELDPKQHAKMRPYPPLNTLHAATVLRNDGYDVAVFDAMLAPDESAFAASLAQHRPEVVVLYEDNFNFLSKMCLTRMREAALAMIGMARAAGCRVAACGADVTDQASLYLAAGVEDIAGVLVQATGLASGNDERLDHLLHRHLSDNRDIHGAVGDEGSCARNWRGCSLQVVAG